MEEPATLTAPMNLKNSYPVRNMCVSLPRQLWELMVWATPPRSLVSETRDPKLALRTRWTHGLRALPASTTTLVDKWLLHSPDKFQIRISGDFPTLQVRMVRAQTTGSNQSRGIWTSRGRPMIPRCYNSNTWTILTTRLMCRTTTTIILASRVRAITGWWPSADRGTRANKTPPGRGMFPRLV